MFTNRTFVTQKYISIQGYQTLFFQFMFFSLLLDIKDVKQGRTSIGLADILIPSSFIYLIYMGGTGPCGPMAIIFGSVI